jgi:hypothetical protein
MIFPVQSWCSFGAESVILHGHYGQKSPYSLDCMDAVTPHNTGWTQTALTSNQVVEWVGALAIGPPGAPEYFGEFHFSHPPILWVFL